MNHGQTIAMLAAAAVVTTLLPSMAQAQIRYVDDDAPLGGNGQSWNAAYRFLQDAFAEASGNPGITEIRAAQGTYKPDQDEAGNVTTGDREATFHLITGAAVLGGYRGAFDGTGLPPDDRDIAAFETILSGDLAGDDEPDFLNVEENSFHVLTAIGTDETAALDGITFTAGNADGPSGDPRSNGGGVYIEAGSPAVSNSTFRANVAVCGAGLYMRDSSATVTNCTFTENRSVSFGGGMYIRAVSSPQLVDCTFIRNESLFSSGALYSGLSNDTPTLVRCSFIENTAERTGGMSSSSDVILEHCDFIANHSTKGAGGGLSANYVLAVDCTFLENVASHEGGGVNSRAGYSTFINCIFERNTAAGNGGGFRSDYRARTTLVNCSFRANVSSGDSGGGGVYHVAGRLTVLNCKFLDNSATNAKGGAIYTRPSTSGSDPGADITNCQISGNTASGAAGGVYIQGSAPVTVTNCTIFGNTGGSGGGLFAQGSPRITNCIVYGNTGGAVDGSSPAVSYSDIEGGWPGFGNIDADPLFAVPPDGALRLSPGSPCIDAGINWAVPADTSDLDGDGDTTELIPLDLDGAPRFSDDAGTTDTGCGGAVIVDMGAYEFPGSALACLRPGDVNGDGTVNVLDLIDLLLAFGASCEVECCPADFDLSGSVDVLDLIDLLLAFGTACP